MPPEPERYRFPEAINRAIALGRGSAGSGWVGWDCGVWCASACCRTRSAHVQKTQAWPGRQRRVSGVGTLEEGRWSVGRWGGAEGAGSAPWGSHFRDAAAATLDQTRRERTLAYNQALTSRGRNRRPGRTRRTTDRRCARTAERGGKRV